MLAAMTVCAGSVSATAVSSSPVDLVLESLAPMSNQFDSTAPPQLRVVVANSGDRPAAGASFSLFVDEEKVAEVPLPVLAPGARWDGVVALPSSGPDASLHLVGLVRAASADLEAEGNLRNNVVQLRVAICSSEEGEAGAGTIESVMWTTEPLYVVDTPFRIDPTVTQVPLLVMMIAERPNDPGWWPVRDRLNSIEAWVNGVHLPRLENGFRHPDTRFWYGLYDIPVEYFDRVDDYNLVRVNLDLWLADDRGPDIQQMNSAWGHVYDPDFGDPLDDAGLFWDGDYWYGRVFRSSSALPNLDPDHWFYGDTHCHTVYTDNSAEIGSPLAPTARAAKACGISWITVTDHSNDYDSDEDAENFKDGQPNPPFARPMERSVEAKWANFLADVNQVNSDEGFLFIPGAEVNAAALREDFPSLPTDFFFHTVAWGIGDLPRAIKGEGQDGMSVWPFGTAESGASGMISANNQSVYNASRKYGDTYALWELLDFLEGSTANGILALAHPYQEFDPNSFSWTDLMMRNPWHEVAGEYPYEAAVSSSYHHPRMVGFQVLNGAPTMSNGLGRSDEAWLGGVAKYIQILQGDLPAFDPSRKLFIYAGTDAHGDFCSHTNRGSNYNLEFGQKYRDLVHVLGKARTAVYLPAGNVTEAAVLDALREGRSLITTGPMAALWVSRGDARFGSGADLRVRRSLLPEVALEIEWATSAEFGPLRQVSVDLIGPDQVRTPLVVNQPADQGTRTIQIHSTLPGLAAGWYALMVRAETDPAAALFQEPGTTYPYRCYGNPLWFQLIDD